MEKILDYIDAKRDEFINALRQLCRQKSISARGEGIRETARTLAGMFSERGGSCILAEGRGMPSVLADFEGASRKTLLFYNHYDVQPPEPLEMWKHPPFAAEIEDGILYARGAADNKADLLARLFAVESVLQAEGRLPARIKFFVEGEEEIGSPNIAETLKNYPAAARADACVWETGRQTFDGRPVICLGVKGMLYAELTARGAARDAHSSLATSVPNAAWRLVWALSALKDAGENIKIEGFFDRVRQVSEEEGAAVRDIPREDENLKEEMGINSFIKGLSGRARVERDIFEPTCTICGMESGYTGAGAKTVLPSLARAKLDFRLVPDQDPGEILKGLKARLEKTGFGDIGVEPFTMERPYRTPAGSDFAKMAARTAGEAYGKKAVIYPSMPGTGPMHCVCAPSGMPCAGTGVGNAKSSMHAPNENILVEDFIKGIRHIALMIKNFADNIGEKNIGKG